MTESRGSGQRYALYLPRTLLAWQAAAPDADVFTEEGTFLLADISGFTAMSEQLAEKGRIGAEEVTGILNAAFTELLDIVVLDSGDLLRFGGDALFNLYTGRDHAARACRSAIDMRDALEVFQRAKSPALLSMSVGIASGTVTGVLGGGSSKELIFIGPTASAVVELQSEAEPGEILISAETRAEMPESTAGEQKGSGFVLEAEPDVDDVEDELPDIDVSNIDLSTFVPIRLRDHLSLTYQEGEHRPATIAFIRFTGTDAVFADSGAKAVQGMVDDLVHTTQDAAERFGVCFLAADVDTNGGKLILSTGVPERTSGHGERMLNALRDIVDAQPALEVHIGAARGHVFAGDLGPRFRRVWTVMGDSVNLAARLASAAAPGQIVVTARVLDQSIDAFDTSELEPMSLRGIGRPVTALAIGRPTGVRDPSQGRLGTALIGRTEERSHLRLLAERMIDGTGTAVEILGRPGMGKTHLVDLALEPYAGSVNTVYVHCERYQLATPFQAAGEMLMSLLDVKEDEPGTLGDAVTAIVRDRAPDLLPWLPLIAGVVGARVPATPETDALAEDFVAEKQREVLVELISHVAESPTAFVIDNAHWADHSSHSLFAGLAGVAVERPWLIVSLRSSTEGEPLTATVESMELAPLETDDAIRLVTSIAGDNTPLPVAEAIANKADGNPFFLVELAKTMNSLDAGDLPETVEGLTLARIDLLRASDRTLLRYASVFGTSFSLDLLADAMPEVAPNVDDPEVWNRLDEFLDTGSVGKVRFRQGIVRDVAYEGLPFQRRADIHQAIASALERRARRRPQRVAETISLHFDRAANWEKSWRYSRMAGDRAVDKLAHTEAIRIFRRALRAAAMFDDAEQSEVLRIREAIGDAAEHVGLFADAEREYDECLASSDDGVLRGRVLRKKGLLCLARGDIDDVEPLLAGALAELERADATGPECSEARLETLVAMAHLNFRQGNFATTVTFCDEAIESADEQMPALGHAYYVRSVAKTHLAGKDGVDDLQRALEIFQSLGDLVSQTNVLNNLGYDAYYRGDWDAAVDLWTRSVETGTRSGDIVRTASSIQNLGEIRLDQGDYAQVEDLLRRALRIWQGAGFTVGIGLAQANLGRLYTRTGRLADAETELDSAAAEFAAARSEPYMLEEIIRRCELLLYQRRPGDALELAGLTIDENADNDGTEVSRSALHRLAGYAKAAMGEHAAACDHVDASLELARLAGADHEIAQTLEAALRIEGANPQRSAAEEEIVHRLGIVARPWLPLT